MQKTAERYGLSNKFSRTITMISDDRTARCVPSSLILSALICVPVKCTHLRTVCWRGKAPDDQYFEVIPKQTLRRNYISFFGSWLVITKARWCAKHWLLSMWTNLKIALTKPPFVATMNSLINITADKLLFNNKGLFMYLSSTHPLISE